MKKIFATFLCMGILIISFGCGPEQSAKDKEDAQYKAIADQQKALLAPFEGRYLGTYTYSDGNMDKVLLSIASISSTTANPQTHDIIVTPTLTGSVDIVAGYDNQGKIKTTGFTLLTFNSGTYDQNSNQLLLSGNYGVATIGGGTTSMVLKVIGINHLRGTASTSLKPFPATIDVVRYTDPIPTVKQTKSKSKK